METGRAWSGSPRALLARLTAGWAVRYDADSGTLLETVQYELSGVLANVSSEPESAYVPIGRNGSVTKGWLRETYRLGSLMFCGIHDQSARLEY